MAPKKRKLLEDVSVYDIGNSTSCFGENAEYFLSIHETDSFDIINNDTADENKITLWIS